jgi:hypothetical protein
MSDTDSFLHEAQQAGRAGEKVEISNLDSAISAITHILDEDVAKQYRETEEDTWPRATMTVYCHDCRGIVPAGIGKTLRGKARTVCGNCHSKKISMGREDALRTFYHLGKAEEKK